MKLIYKRRTSKLITGRLKSLLCLFRLACRCVTPCVRFPSLAVRLPLYSIKFSCLCIAKTRKGFSFSGFYVCLGLVLLIQLCTARLIWPGYALPLRISLPSTPSRLSSSPSSGSFSVCRCPCFLICTPYPYQT